MKLSYLIICLLCLFSCAFEPEGLSFFDVTKPAASQPLELTLTINEDSIYLYGDTRLSFSLATFGKTFNVARIHYYDQAFSTDKPNDSFTITPKATTGWVDLTIDFYVSTGTGSIADKLKVENYVLSKTWKIKYIDLNKVGLNEGYRIHPDGYLEVYLVQPRQKHDGSYGVSKYGNTIPVTRISGDTAFYADKSYCSDACSYSFWFRFDANNIFRKDLIVNLPKAELKVEAIGLDSCRVSWTKSPLKLYYTLNETLYKGFANEYKTTILSSESKYFSLGVFPPNYQNQTFSTYKVDTYFNLGTAANYFMCYAVEKDKFFISRDLGLPYIESANIPLPASDPNSQYKSKVNILCSPNGKYIAGYLYSQIYVYNENLTFSKKIVADEISNYRPYYSITNDGAFTYQLGATIVMKNLTGIGWDTFSFISDLNPNPNTVYFSVIANSIDGKYMSICGLSEFRIYDVSDHKAAKVVFKLPAADVGSVVAHPTNPGLIYVIHNGKMELRTCPGFDLVKAINIPVSNYYFHSVDPFSNILLLMTDKYYYFIDPDTSKELLKLRLNSVWDYNVKLVRNQFETYLNILDLTNYLIK